MEVEDDNIEGIIYGALYDGYLDSPLNLFNIFSSTKDEKAKVERLRSFFKGLIEYQMFKRKKPLDCVMRNIVEYIGMHLERIIDKYKDKEDDEIMKQIDACHGCNFKPYLPLSAHESIRMCASDDGTKVGSSEKKMSRQSEKHFQDYKDFMNLLHLLAILYTGCLKCEELCEEDFVADYTPCFRKDNFANTTIRRFLEKFVDDPSKCGSVPWHVEIMLKRCPFISFGHSDVNYILSRLKGGKVDKDLEDEFLADLYQI